MIPEPGPAIAGKTPLPVSRAGVDESGVFYRLLFNAWIQVGLAFALPMVPILKSG